MPGNLQSSLLKYSAHVWGNYPRFGRFRKEPSRVLEGTVTSPHVGLGTKPVPTNQTGKTSWGLG